MHEIEYRRSALKEIKKLDKPIRKELIFQVESLALNPSVGKEVLKGDLSGYLSFDFAFKGVEYRLIYTIDGANRKIIIEMVGSRENIYKKLKQRV